MMISLCGKSGSGKSMLANELLKVYGNKAIHLDIDKIGHKILTFDEVKRKLIQTFGNSVMADGTIDREILGNIVFSSKDAMDKLTDITWEAMQVEIDKVLKENSNFVIILDWQLLPLSKYFSMSDIKILLDVPYEVRLSRAMKRDSITEEQFALREKASLDYHLKDFDIVFNDVCRDFIKRMVKLL